jgi:hypothetical protein
MAIASLLFFAAAASASFAPLHEAFLQIRQHTLSQAPRMAMEAQYSRELERRLGPFASWLNLPGITAAEMSAEISSRLKSKKARDLVMGESHAVPAEEASGKLFMKDLLDAGWSFKALLREKNTYDDATDVESRGMAVLTMRNQFRPLADVEAALALPGRTLAAYSGNVHTSDRLAKYFMDTLEDGRVWGGNMPTVEGALKDNGRKAVIVAMMPEHQFLDKIQRLSLRDMLGKGVTHADLVGKLEAFNKVWLSRLGSGVNGSMRFIQTPEQENLFIGLTPTERAPRKLEAMLEVMRRPDVAAWSGTDVLRLVETLPGTFPNEQNQVCTYHDIVLHKTNGETLERRLLAPTPYVCPERPSSAGAEPLASL